MLCIDDSSALSFSTQCDEQERMKSKEREREGEWRQRP